MKMKKETTISKEQEFLGMCYRIREYAKELLQNSEHVIRLHENKENSYRGVDLGIGNTGPEIIEKNMREWLKSFYMRPAMYIVFGLKNFAYEHLKEHIDIFINKYDSDWIKQLPQKTKRQ